MRKVFVSYARVNRAQVDKLVEHLGFLDCQTWIDSSLRGGQQWWDEILKNIADCDVFLPIVSRDALNSTACQREFDWAHALGKPVLPVAVEPLSTALPARLSVLQVIDYFDAGKGERNALALAGALSTMPPAPPLPEPMPTPPAAPLSYLTDLVELVSGPQPLDHEQQRQLLVQVEQALRSVDPHEREGGLDVLERFSSRDNLYADVDRRLAWLKANAVGPSAQPAASQPRKSPPVAPPSGDSTPKRKQRKARFALVAALVVVAAACVVAYLVWPRAGTSRTQNAQSATPLGQTEQPASPARPTTPPAGPTTQSASSGAQTVLPFTGLLAPIAVAVDSGGSVYVADNRGVSKLTAGATASVQLPLAGVGTPDGLATDTAGNIYISDYSKNTVWKLGADASAPTALQFNGLKCGEYDSPLANPEGVAVDNAGTLYVADAACQGRVLSLAAGSSTPTVLPFTGLRFLGQGTPQGVAVDGAGNVYVTDVGNARVLKLAPGSNTPTTLPFTGLKTPVGVAVKSSGDIYITDSGNKQVLNLPSGSSTPTAVPFTDLRNPVGVAVDGSGNVYVVDTEKGQALKLAG